jgi:alkylation response protein AidB-like acyl-CoA dehydrogenase
VNLNDSPEQAAFRGEVKAWIAAEVPPRLKGLRQGIVMGHDGLSDAELAPLDQALRRKGWHAPQIPKEYGGAGLDVARQVILREELTRAGVPLRDLAVFHHLVPVLIRYGTPEQRQKFIVPTLERKITWCQGSSEPGAGSDLASLTTRADRVEGGFRVTGQKIWTSLAHKADWIFMLVRTNPNAARKHEGISMLLVDMKSPGITVRPIITMDGFHHFNETFYDNVFVPERNAVVGEVDKGWQVMRYSLGNEKFLHNLTDPMRIGLALDNLKSDARTLPDGAGVVWDDPALRRTVAELEMQVDALKCSRWRALTKVAQGQKLGEETAFFKFFAAELWQRVVDLHQQVSGPLGITWNEAPFGRLAYEVARHATNIRAATIRGGTSEVARNGVAKRALELPNARGAQGE